MSNHRTHEITHDSYGNELSTPLRVEVREFTDAIVLVMHDETGAETASVHLEIDARRGGAVVLRAWDSRPGNYGEDPFIEEALILEEDDA